MSQTVWYVLPQTGIMGERHGTRRTRLLGGATVRILGQRLDDSRIQWSNFLRYLKERGLKGVRLIVSDKCLGLYEIIGDFFPEAKWQRCIVHWYRNAFTMCPWKHLREVVAMLKAIHAQEDKAAAARQKAALVAEKLRAMKLERIAGFVETSVEETLSYMDFPYEHWSRLRTNNGLERIMKEIRRRTRVVGSFPMGTRR